MTTKEYLSLIGRLDKMIASKVDNISELKSSMYGIGCLQGGERVQTSPNHDPLGTRYVVDFELEEKYRTQIALYDDLREAIKLQIISLPNEMYRNVLFGKYVDGKSLEIIADEVNRSYKHITKMHGKALVEFENRFKSKYANVDGMQNILEMRLNATK